jgi:site-specific DNA recombinase
VGVRFKAEVTNELFNAEIAKYMPYADTDKLYVELILKAFKENTSEENDERKRIMYEIDTLNKKVSDSRELLLSGCFDGGDFRAIKLDIEKKISVLESKLPELSKSLISLRSDLTVGISNLQKAESQYKNGNPRVKRDIIGSIFPENLCSLNIRLINKELKNKKSGLKLIYQLCPLQWYGPGSNRRHMDFQSIALPTELPYHLI